MPAKKYIVKLTDEERQSLDELTSRGEVRARTMKRAQIYLLNKNAVLKPLRIKLRRDIIPPKRCVMR